MKIKFLHCADLHLDSPFSSINENLDKVRQRKRDLRDCFSKIIDIAILNEVEFFIIAGDFFEHNYISKDTMDFIENMLSKVSHIPVLISAGNHDPLINGSFYNLINNMKNVYVFGDYSKIEIEDKNLVIYGEGFTNFYKNGLNFRGDSSLDKNKFNIFITHGSLNIDVGQNKYNPMTLSQLINLNMDYIAIGHFHNRLINDLENEVVYNPGSPEPLGFDEPFEHGIYIVEIEKYGDTINRNVEFIETAKRKYHTIKINITNVSNVEEFQMLVNDKFQSLNVSENDLLKFQFVGNRKYNFKILPIYLKDYVDNYFYFKYDDKTSEYISIDSLIEEGGISGLFAKKMLNLINSTEDEDEKKNLTNALNIGIESIKNSDVDIDKYFN